MNLEKEADDLLKEHIRKIYNETKDVIVVSKEYPGIWLEHIYDSFIYGELYGNYSYALNEIELFIKNQKNGLLPCFLKDKDGYGYSQLQECVSFYSLCLKLYEKNNLLDLNIIFKSGLDYLDFIYNYRIDKKSSLVKIFVGYDTGHDNSARLDSLKYKTYYSINNVRQNANVKNDSNDYILGLDLSCVLYGNLISLSKIASILNSNLKDELYNKALILKKSIYKYLYDPDSNFFYDVDKNYNFIKVKSVSFLHLFQEFVLDKDEEITKNLINNYLLNEEEFNSSFPIPSVSLNEKTRLSHKIPNSWGYYSQALTAIRMSIYYKEYGLESFYIKVLKAWIVALEKNYKQIPFSQEIDPITGVSSVSSKDYSTSLLLYLYAKRLLK